MAETIIKRKIIKKRKKKGKKDKKTITQKQKQRQSVVVNVFTGRGKKGLVNKPLSIPRQKEKDRVSALNMGASRREPLSVGTYTPMANYYDLEQRVQQSVKRSELMNAQVLQAQKREKMRDEAEARRAYEKSQLQRIDKSERDKSGDIDQNPPQEEELGAEEVKSAEKGDPEPNPRQMEEIMSFGEGGGGRQAEEPVVAEAVATGKAIDPKTIKNKTRTEVIKEASNKANISQTSIIKRFKGVDKFEIARNYGINPKKGF